MVVYSYIILEFINLIWLRYKGIFNDNYEEGEDICGSERSMDKNFKCLVFFCF